MENNPRLLIAGGGTGGHVLAGVAVADEWRRHWGVKAPILFVGAQGGLEEKLVPQAGYSLQILKLGSFNQVSFRRKLKTLVRLPLAFLFSFQILLKIRPHYVLGVGGYASGPLVMAASIFSAIGLCRIKIAILEQNSVPGLTNRILSRFSDLIFTAFPEMDRKFPKKRVVVTGNPIRSSMKLLPPAQLAPFTLFIFGGSQGAFGINSLILEALGELKIFKEQIRIIHQTGENDFERVSQEYQKIGMQGRVEKFIEDMPVTYAVSSLLICRAGSSTLAELAAVGRASILIPLPTAADNHQEMNARVFSEAGAACLFLQQNSNGKKLADLIRDLILNPNRISKMEKAVTQFYRPDAARDVALGLSLLREPTPC